MKKVLEKEWGKDHKIIPWKEKRIKQENERYLFERIFEEKEEKQQQYYVHYRNRTDLL